MTSKFSIDNRELLQRISSGEAVVGIDFGNLIVRELAAFRLAAMDSEAKEPISFDEWSRKCALQITLCYPDFREKAQYIWDSARETQHVAQPAPVVPEEITAEQAYEIGDYHGDPVDVFARGANWMRQHIINSTLAASPQEDKP
jgi:hypothetical protein|nr:MAG TPA: hypothetical protein [Caudoviricetes sp.]